MSSSTRFERAALGGNRELPRGVSIKTVSQLIEFNARENPAYVFCKQERLSQNGDQAGFHDVTYSKLQNAVLACQERILRELDGAEAKYDRQQNARKRPPVALLMESDLSILIYLFSLFGLGIPVLLLSVRLSPLAIKSLVAETDASVIYASPRYESLAKEALNLIGSEHLQPTLSLRLPYKVFLDSPIIPSRHRVYDDSHYLGEHDRDVLILHSSGTTGLPKAIRQSHGYILNYATCHDFSDANAAQRWNLSTLPLFHGFGLIAPLLSMSVGKSFIIPSSKNAYTGAQIAKLLKQCSVGSLMTVPAILQELVDLDDSETVKALQNMDFVACGGGTLKESLGEYLTTAGVAIVNSYGCTEAGPLSLMYIPASNYDWRYFTLRTDMGIEVLRDGQSDNDRFRLVVRPPGWVDTFEMQDFFRMNPKAPSREFRPLERTDDVIVLRTGEKVSPHILENIIAERDDVRGALIFGDGQAQLGVIVESREALTSSTLDIFVDSILDTIREAGQSTDAHARIVAREAVVVLQPGQSLPRSDKSAILRKAAYEAYRDEIEKSYELFNDASAGKVTNILKGDIAENLQQLVKTQILRPDQPHDFTSSTDLFDLGIDSLQATQLRRCILSSISAEIKDPQIAADMVQRDFVYSYPSISKMVGRLSGTLELSASMSKEEAMQSVIEEYSIQLAADDLPQKESRPSTRDPIQREGAVVLLTGASGGLGSHLLAQLAAKGSVASIVCLNRPGGSISDSYQRQYDSNKTKGADLSEVLRKKIQVINTDTSRPYLGLSESVYYRLASMVTHLVHNAWPMDFKRQLESFRQQFRVLSNLIRFVQDANKTRYSSATIMNTVPVRLLFVSSISVVGNHDKGCMGQESVIVPEEPTFDPHRALSLGYAEAKLVCEKIVQNATQAGVVDGVVVRMGQLSGAIANGYWNTSEHFPLMVQCSVRVGALPQLHGTLSWLPLEPAAGTIADILLSTGENVRPLYHVENPKRQPWGPILLELSHNFSLRLVSYKEWIDLVRGLRLADVAYTGSENAGDDDASNDLLDFFVRLFERMSSGSVVLSTVNTEDVSPTLRQSEVVTVDLLGRYLKYWRASGFLPSASEL